MTLLYSLLALLGGACSRSRPPSMRNSAALIGGDAAGDDRVLLSSA